MKDLDRHPTRGGVGLVIVLLIVLGLAAFYFYQRNGPWTDVAKNRIELDHEINSIFTDLEESYSTTQAAIRIVSKTLRENGDMGDEDFNRVFRESDNKDRFLTHAVGAEKTMAHLAVLANELYRTHGLTKDNLKTIDALGEQVRRNSLFNLQLTKGTINADMLEEWNGDVDRFAITSSRMKTDLGLD